MYPVRWSLADSTRLLWIISPPLSESAHLYSVWWSLPESYQTMWGREMYCRYALLKLGGGNVNTDHVHLLTLIEYLDGTALTWFTNHVLNTKCTIVHWTFCDVITVLYARFVLSSMMHEARESFWNVRYTTLSGVQEFYDELVQHGSNMAMYPDQHTLLEEFLKGIPQEMQTHCFKEFGPNPESNNLDDFVSTTLCIEHGNIVEAYYNTITLPNLS